MEKKRIKRYDEKLEFLTQLIENLDKWTNDIDEAEFNNNINLIHQYGIYHAFQLAIETVLDLIAMMVKDSKHLTKDNYTNIELLENESLISHTLSKDLRESVGLRNRIVHDYNGLDSSIAYKSLIKLKISIKDFKEEISKWLKNK
jgi:uncharacterized protein YutE (UPF0331/DUF86 family)